MAKVNIDAYKHIKNVANNEADMLLHGELGKDLMGREFASELMWLDSLGLDSINIRANSVGGIVWEGMAIISAIMGAKTHINMIVEGLAASMMSTIILFGDHIKMMDFGIVLIHDPSIDGQEARTEKQQKLLDKVSNSLVLILKNRTGMEEDEIRQLMKEETLFDAQEAFDKKFIHEVIPSTLDKDDPKLKAALNAS